MTNYSHPRFFGAAIVAAPVLLFASTIIYVVSGEGMNVGEAAGAIQVWAMIAFAIAFVFLARLLEPTSPRAATVLTVLGLVGAAGGVGYGIDSIQAAIFGGGSIQETNSAVAPIALQLPGVLFPASLVSLGVMLARRRCVARWMGITLAVGAVLFPMSRIPDIEGLAVLSDVLLLVALIPLGWRIVRSAAVTETLASPARVEPATAVR